MKNTLFPAQPEENATLDCAVLSHPISMKSLFCSSASHCEDEIKQVPRRSHSGQELALTSHLRNPNPKSILYSGFPAGLFPHCSSIRLHWIIIPLQQKKYIHTEKISLNKSTFEVLPWEINFKQQCVVMEIHISNLIFVENC